MPQHLLLDIGPSAGGHGARGIGRYVRGLTDAIGQWPAERQEIVWALSPTGDAPPLFEGRSVSAPLLKIRPLDLGWIVGSPAIGRAVRRAGASVFHATDPHRPSRLRGVRQIVTAYDLIPLHEPGMLDSWQPHHRHAYRVYLDQLRHADAIVAISATTADDVSAQLGIDPARISIVYPLVQAPAVVERAPAAEPTFLFLGALDSHKQPGLAVAALAEFRRVHGAGKLTFIGPSGPESRARLEQLAAAAGVADQVGFLGRVSDDQLDAEFAAATALLCTSRIEGFGLPGVEALLRGVPVIAVDTPAARETVGSAATLVESSAEAIAGAMATPMPVADVTRQALTARFSLRATADSLWAVYERTLG